MLILVKTPLNDTLSIGISSGHLISAVGDFLGSKTAILLDVLGICLLGNHIVRLSSLKNVSSILSIQTSLIRRRKSVLILSSSHVQSLD